MFFGNIIGGAFVALFHVLVVTNIDNVLRPVLVPRAARLDPALMLLAVFSGIALWGFWGIVIGPVLMIIIVTTISVYLWVYKGVELEPSDDDADEERGPPAPVRWWRGLRTAISAWRRALSDRQPAAIAKKDAR